MRLLHVTPTYLPSVRYGGPIRSVHGLCAALAGGGHEVDVLTTGVDGRGELDVDYRHPVEIDGVRVRYFRTGAGRRLYRSPDMAAHLRDSVGGYDAVHLHSVYLWTTLAGARAAAAAGVPYVVAPRGMLVAQLIRRRSRLPKQAWIALFERRTLARAGAIHVTSELEGEHLRALGLDLARVVVVPNGVAEPPPCTAPDTAEVAESTGRGPFALFLGRFEHEKGLDRLIPALAAAPGLGLVIAGYDAAGRRPGLEAIARGHGIADRIRWLGAVAGADKAWLLARATMLVLPSYSESFGNVVVEALAAGCPVVTTPEVGVGRDVAAAGAGVVCDGAPAVLGEALAALAADDRRRDELARRGRDLVARRYRWDRVGRSMADVYATLIAEGRG